MKWKVKSEVESYLKWSVAKWNKVKWTKQSEVEWAEVKYSVGKGGTNLYGKGL
jgi:hypothetical protein